MSPLVRDVPAPVFAGICLALTAILFGFGLGGAFGAVEDSIKKRLDDSGTAALETAYHGDVAAKDGWCPSTTSSGALHHGGHRHHGPCRPLCS